MKDLLGIVLPLAYLAIFYGYTYFSVHYPTDLNMDLIGTFGISWIGMLILGCSFLAIVYVMDGISENRGIVLLGIIFLTYIIK